MSEESLWSAVVPASSVAEGEMVGVVVGGRNVAIYNIDGQFCATDDICPHGQALLSQGFLEEGIVECPLHAGRFDVCTGQPLGPPVDTPIAVYPVRVVSGQVEVNVNAAPEP